MTGTKRALEKNGGCYFDLLGVNSSQDTPTFSLEQILGQMLISGVVGLDDIQSLDEFFELVVHDICSKKETGRIRQLSCVRRIVFCRTNASERLL